MVGSSRILTVSYGTFSCTLEGFDEPFNTMKSIAEYFRDLASEDRYFGAEPPTPDADMLHRIAEREVQKRVEARVGDNGVVLRQLAAGGAAVTGLAPDQPAPQQAAPQPAPQPEVARAPEPTPAPAPAPEPMPAPAPAAQAEAAPRPAAPQAPAPAEAEEVDPESDSVAAKLARIRAAVARARASRDAMAATYEEDEPTETAYLGSIDAAFAAPEAPEAPIEAPIEESAGDAATDWTPEADETESPWTSAQVIEGRDEAPEATPATPGATPEEAPAEAPEAVQAEAEVEEVAPEAAPAAETEAEDEDETALDEDETLARDLAMLSEAEDEEAAADEPLFDPDEDAAPFAGIEAALALDDAEELRRAAARDEIAALDAQLAADIAASAERDETEDAVEAALHHEAGEAEAEAEVQDDDEEDIFAGLSGEDESPATEDDLAEADHIFAESPEETAEEDEDEDIFAGLSEEDADAPEAETEAEDEDDIFAGLSEEEAPEATAADEDDDDEEIEIEAEDEDALVEGSDRPQARIIKLKRRDFEAALAAGDIEEIDEDDEDGETAEAGPAAREDDPITAGIRDVIGETSLDEEQENDLLEELAEVEREAAEAASREADRHEDDDEAGTPEEPSDEQALDRLLSKTNAKLGESENSRRRSAIAHLKAAVAATKADRLLKGGRRDRARETEMNKFRDDLAQVVRPRRPHERDAGAAAVTPRPGEQAGDRPAPLMLVSELRIDRPQRPASAGPVRPRRVAADTPAEQPAAAEAADQAVSFSDFAKRVGATELTDILEAAAAYATIVEGQEGVSRPQLLRRAASLAPEAALTREEGLRSFGQLLRTGRIRKLGQGRFAVAEEDRYAEFAQAAGE